MNSKQPGDDFVARIRPTYVCDSQDRQRRKSNIAVQASVRVVRACVRLREMVAANAQLAVKLNELERRLDSHDEAIVNLFAALKGLLEPPVPTKKREIGFQVRERSSRYRTN